MEQEFFLFIVHVHTQSFFCLSGVISLHTQVTTTFIYVRVAYRYKVTMYVEEFDFYELEGIR
jgi:hypothetical protein